MACPCYSDVFVYSNGAMHESKLFSDAGSSGSTYLSSSQILGLANGEMALVTCEQCNGFFPQTVSGAYISAQETSGQGSSWGNPVSLTSSTGNEPQSFAADTLGSTVFVGFQDLKTNSVESTSLNYGSSSGNPVVSVLSTSDYVGITMSKDTYGNLEITVADPTAQTINVYKSTNSGGTWPLFEKLSWTADLPITYAITQTTSTSATGLTGIGWEQGATEPKDIEFASFPLIVPNPSIISNSWSRPGLSPYESYFSHLDDSISPGNGLLVLKQDDLSLPGRNGLDSVISRVFMTPYGFGPGNYSVGYDNYTLANFGLGWQLNFPWMGNNYLHLPDGEVYQYQWNSSNIFENHAETNFDMYHWSNGTYDLYLADGTRYHFYANQSLAYERDATGSNSLTFYYQSGRISSIVDTVGRVISFSYNPSGQVASISYAGMTWTYGYSGSNLVSVTDPLGRVTSYAYASRINDWLMTNVTYPTGGRTNFSYGREPVGTEDYTYQVVLANTYSSPTQLDESNSYSYTVSNGIVSFCNETTEDGTLGIQGYDIYQFSVSGSGVEYVPITLTNSQSSPVSSGTQVMLTVDWQNYASNLASNVQNVMFFDSSGNPIYAWCESSCTSSSASSVVWLKLDQSIPASSSATVYLEINGSTTTNNFSPSGYWGEYPTATSTYGQYDNGAKVFNYYTNFAGTSLPSGWTAQSVTGLTVSVSNGLTISEAGNIAGGAYGAYYNFGSAQSNDVIMDSYGDTSSPYMELQQGFSNGATAPAPTNGQFTANGYEYEFSCCENNAGNYLEKVSGGTYTNLYSSTSTPTYASDTFYTFGNLWDGSSLENYLNYAGYGSSTDTTFSNYNYIVLANYGGNTGGSVNSMFFQWVRTRTPPPNNVMPWASFGAPQTSSSHTVEDASHSQLMSYTTFSDFQGRTVKIQTFGPSETLLYTTYSSYDNWGNVITSTDAIGHETWSSYANTNSFDTFIGAGSSFTNSFYTNNTVISPYIHDALVGEASLQNGPGSAQMETYYNYNAAGELIHQKQLYVPSGNQGYLQNVGNGNSAGPTSTLTVNSVAENGAQISGYYTVLYQNGKAIATGFTPVTFSLNNSQEYQIQVQNYGSYAFDYWADTGNATQTRSISIDSNTALLAVYKTTGGSTPPSGDSIISVNTQLPNGNKITGFYTTLWQNNKVIASGFSPVNFTVTCCETYAVEVSNYGDYVFSNWADGNISRMQGVTPLNQGTVILSAVLMDKWLVSSYAYDQYGNQLSATDPLGRTTFFQYSSTYDHAYMTQQSIIVSGKNVSTSYTYNFTLGLENSVTDPNGQTTYYSFDNLGRLIQTVYPRVNGVTATSENSYDDKNNILTTTDPNGNIAKQYYDGLGRLVEVQRYNGSSVYSTETYTYNWQNKVATDKLPTGGTYTYYYDALGRQTETLNPDSTSSTTSYNPSGSTNIQTVTDENGHQTEYGYDWTNNLLFVRQYYSSTGYYLASYSYDQSGNLLSITDPNNNVTTYQYDNLNRLTLTKYPDGTSQASIYDNVGNLLTKTDPMGNVISYSYDSLNRLLKVTYPNETSASYTYDGDGNRLSMVDKNSGTYYSYDARDRLANQTSVITSTRYSILYSYDKASNIVMLTYPDGYKLNYTYDALERVSNVGSFANFSYTLDDKISAITYANGVVTSYSYNSRDMPTQITSMLGNTKLQSLAYKYDGVGNVLSINNENFTYDYLNRIISAVGSWGTLNYTYDGSGNMLSMTKNGAKTQFSYSSYNRLDSMGSITFQYNSDGDMAKQVNGSNTFTYSYDYENRLTSITKNSALLESNIYNPDGERIEAMDGSSTTYYFYEGSSMIASLSGTSWLDNIYGNGMLLAQASGSSSYYYQNDALGSTRLVTASTGAILYSSDYLPFGASFGTSGSFTPEFEYTGKLVDVSGLYYYGARFYDPSIDRFITEDTSTGSPGDPLSLDRYVYARDNPEAITDPTGHDWWSSLTSAVSNGASDVASGAEAVASAADGAWNSLPPGEQQAIEVTAVVAAAAGVTVATGGIGLVAVPSIVSYGLGSAAISSGIYTLTSGGHATAAGALGAAVAGGLSAGIGAGVVGAGLGTFGSGALVFGGTAGSDVLGSDVTAAAGGTSPDVNPAEVGINAAIAAATFGLGGPLADEAGFSSSGRPATATWKLIHSFFYPDDYPRAAWQVYSGLFNAGISAGGQATAYYFSHILSHVVRNIR